MKLTAIGVGNYRSIGDRPVRVNLEKRVNILIGANNSGKSNVIKSLLQLKELVGNANVRLNETEWHRRNGAVAVSVCLAARQDPGRREIAPAPDDIEFELQVTAAKGLVCTPGPFDSLSLSQLDRWRQDQGKPPLMGGLSPSGEKLALVKSEEGLSLVRTLLGSPQLPPFYTVPQFRQILPAKEYALDGKGIVELLASWQHPPIGEDRNRERFDKIQGLLKKLLHLPHITIEVPPRQDQIIVANNDLRLPLESYGTGTHELIILAIAVLSADDSIFCTGSP